MNRQSTHRCPMALVVALWVTTSCCGMNLAERSTVSATNPEAARASYERGNQLLAAGDYGGAAEAYTDSISNDPSQAQAYNNRAIAYTQLGQRDLALDDLNRALALRANDPEILYNLGNVQLRRGFYLQAAEMFERVLALRPDDNDAKNNLAVALLQLGDLDRAEELLQEVLSEQPDHTRAIGNLGAVYEQRGEIELAMTMYRRALDIDPSDATSLLNLGMLEVGEGMTESAIEHLERFLQVRPTSIYAARVEATLEDLQN